MATDILLASDGGDSLSSTSAETVCVATARKEIVFIDTGVRDDRLLLDGIRPGLEIVLIDGTRTA